MIRSFNVCHETDIKQKKLKVEGYQLSVNGNGSVYCARFTRSSVTVLALIVLSEAT